MPFLLRIIRLFLFGSEAQRHANKGAHQIAEHRLCPRITYPPLETLGQTMNAS